MIRFIFPIVTIASIMTMGACSGSRDPVADNADNPSASQAEIDVLPPDESDSTPANELDAGVDDASASPVKATPGKIPASLHGRWGMTPADCSSTRGDAKGLLIVSADALKFYESVAKPVGELKTSGTSASGDFAFTGEGMTWKRYEALEIQSNKLVRTESSPMKSFAYVRCA
jgi:hypothetical protein